MSTPRIEKVSRLLSSMGCSWNSNATSSSDANSTTASISIESIPAHKLSYPCFSLTKNISDEQEDVEGKKYESDSDSSSHRREAAQSEASKLMSRKSAFSQLEVEDKIESLSPQRLMLENILASFDQLVDARIRAYARILSNHVRVLSESDNTKGAQIAEYKLQTLIDVAANHLLFDSISTGFKTSTSSEDRVNNGDVIATDSTASNGDKKETNLTIPIELIVEIQSPRFFHECLEAIDCTDVTRPAQRGHQGKLIFLAKGKLRVSNESNDGNICSTPSRNSAFDNRIRSNSLFERAEIEIDCDALLSQMMNEASKVVAMAVELTNMAWTNNTEKQEEINMIADNTRKTANIIVDEDSSTAGECLLQRTTGKRSRSEEGPEARTGTGMSKQVSEASLVPSAHVVCDEEQGETSEVSHDTSVSIATITNLHVLEQDAERKARYFHVSSYDSSSTGTDHDHQTEKCPLEDQDKEFECYKMKRACAIVDFALAGGSDPWYLTPNKKLRTK